MHPGSIGQRCAAIGALLAVVGLANIAPTAAQTRFEFDRTPGRLSKDVVPAHYALELDLDPARDTFRGEVVVTLRVRQPVAAIELHAEKLQAERVALETAGGAARKLSAQPDAAAQLWKLVPDDGAPIAAGEHQLRIAYRGSVGKSGTGLFQGHAPTAAAAEAMLATQLAPIHARDLLPVFDEPAFRAVFELTVRAPAGYEVLGNMPRAERRRRGRGRGAPLRADAAHAELPGRARGRPLRRPRGPGRRRAAAHLHRAGQARAGALRAWRSRASCCRYFALLRRAVRASEARPAGGALDARARWRTGG